jgi:hypothetical protein
MYGLGQDNQNTTHTRTSHALYIHFTPKNGVEIQLYVKFPMRPAIILTSTYGGELDRPARPQIELTLTTFTTL